MFINVGSINDSGINVKKCTRRSGLKLWSANKARIMRFKEPSKTMDGG